MLIKAKLLHAIVILLHLFPILVNSQYSTFEIKTPYSLDNINPIEIVQIDFHEHSTLVHFTLTNPVALGGYFYISEDFKLIDKKTNLNYKLLNSYNLPLDNSNIRGHLEELGDKLNFTLEFEKVDESLTVFDLVENEGVKHAFNFYGIEINKKDSSDELIDLDQFLSQTPVKTINFYYNEGSIVQFHKDQSGLIVAAQSQLDKNYGKYYKINFSIQNLTGENINIFPDDIRAFYITKFGVNDIQEAKVLSYQEYMKKIKNRQNWNAIALSFSEGLAASSAGYTSSTSYESNYSYDGYSYSNSYGTNYTTSYDGTAAYIAQQNAMNSINNYQNQQYEIRNTISEGYLKINTLPNETEYLGYVNIPFSKKIKTLKVIVPINGKEYTFIF